MNDRWKGPDGKRWARADKVRAAKRFRSHVRTPSNPAGRIIRDKCWFCMRDLKRSRQGHQIQRMADAGAHHVDYSKPFLVAWLCEAHHRRVDHGLISLPKMALHDYSSLIPIRRGLEGNQNALKDSRVYRIDEMSEVETDVPF
jgi:hypothetical protein